MSAKQSKIYRKTVRKLVAEGRFDLAALVTRGGQPAKRRHLLRALGRDKLVRQKEVTTGSHRLFLKKGVFNE